MALEAFITYLMYGQVRTRSIASAIHDLSLPILNALLPSSLPFGRILPWSFNCEIRLDCKKDVFGKEKQNRYILAPTICHMISRVNVMIVMVIFGLIVTLSIPAMWTYGTVKQNDTSFLDDIRVYEVEIPGGVALVLPYDGINEPSSAQVVNTSFYYQNQPLYLALEIYPPNENNTCGGGNGGGGEQFDDILSVLPSNLSSSPEGVVIKDVSLIRNGTGFIQTVVLPNDDILCAKSGWR